MKVTQMWHVLQIFSQNFPKQKTEQITPSQQQTLCHEQQLCEALSPIPNYLWKVMSQK